MATHSSILASRIPWTEEPGGLQSTGSQRLKHYEQLSKIYRINFYFLFRLIIKIFHNLVLSQLSILLCKINYPTYQVDLITTILA